MQQFAKVIRSGNSIESFEYERKPEGRHGINANKGHLSWCNGDPFKHLHGCIPEAARAREPRREDNGRRAAVAFRRLVKTNLQRKDKPIMALFTFERNEVDEAKARQLFGRATRALCYRFGDLCIISVMEFQERGAIHFHALIWGLPKNIVWAEMENREIAKAWGQGFVYLKYTNGSHAMAYYLGKYLTKTYKDHRLKGKKAYVCTQNVDTPEIVKGESLGEIFKQLGLSNLIALQTHVFNTQWCGTAIYRRYLNDLKYGS